MTTRQEQLRRLTESLRRYTKVNTYFGMVPIPVGNLSTLVFPINRARENYLMLSAQTKSIEGRIELAEIEEVVGHVRDIYRRGYRCRNCAYFFVKSFSYLFIMITFLFLILLFLTLVRNAGVENLYILLGFVCAIALLFFSHWGG